MKWDLSHLQSSDYFVIFLKGSENVCVFAFPLPRKRFNSDFASSISVCILDFGLLPRLLTVKVEPKIINLSISLALV